MTLQVYVSYARHDDLPPLAAPNADGFVSTLVNAVEYRLKQFGPPAVTLWRDRFDLSESFGDAVESAIRDSQLMLVVLSRNWLASAHCSHELELFERRFDDPRSRLIVVAKDDVAHARRPSALRDQVGYAFYRIDEAARHPVELFGVNGPTDGFYDVVEQLARDLRKRADGRDASAQSTPAPPAVSEAARAPRSAEASAEPQRRRKIAISYRRADSAAISGRIYDSLVNRFGDDEVFIDIDGIPFGEDFREYIAGTLRDASALLVIIGPRWLGRRRAKPSRIQDENDLVRIEVETALRLGIRVLPILVEGAAVPSGGDLPPLLAEKLPFLNAAAIDSGRDYKNHVERLIRSLERV